MTCRCFVILLCTAPAIALGGCGRGGGVRGEDELHHAGPAASSATRSHAVAPALVHWRFRGDPRDRGLRATWQRRPNLAMRAISVPYVPGARAISGPAGERAYQGSVGWYRADATIPRAGVYAIRFASANHAATVFLDGRQRCAHAGAYVPFTCALKLAAGRHDLAVRVDWRSPVRARAEGFDRSWFNWGGLNRPVGIAALGPTLLGAPRVRTVLRDGGATAEVQVSVMVRDLRGADRTVAVSGTLGASAVRFDPVTVRGGHGALARARVTVRDPDLWAPGHPALTALVLRAPGTAPVRERIGLRELTWPRGRLLLNGRPMRLRGASLPPDAVGHGDALSPADDDRIIAELHALGANATRAQYPLDDELLDRLDAAGILVWQEVGPFDPAGAFRSRTPALRARARRRVVATVRREQAHPSVIAWSLANEAAGQGHPAGQARFVDTMAARLHRLDPGRLVAADLWGPHLPRHAGLLHRNLDAIGLTSYVGWYEQFGAPRVAQDATLTRRVAGLRALFPAKVLVASEFGAVGNRANPPGLPGSEAFQAALVGHQAGLLRTLPGVSGVLVFLLRDYALHPGFDGGSAGRAHPEIGFSDALNEKGLFRFDGTAKPAAAAVRRAFG